MKAKSAITLHVCYMLPASVATFGSVSQGAFHHSGLLYWLVFLAVPLLLAALNAFLSKDDAYERFFVRVCIAHTALWLITHALNSLMMGGVLYNLVAMPLLCVLLVLALPFSIMRRLKKSGTAQVIPE